MSCVIVVHGAAMRKAVVLVLEMFYWQGREAAWGLMSNVAATVAPAVAAAVAATTANVATTVYIATATPTV